MELYNTQLNKIKNKMNKQGKTDNRVIAIVVVLAVILVLFLWVSGTGMKQKPTPIEFGEDTSEPGGLKIELVGEEGDRGYMDEDFYKITSGGFAIIRGATAVSCTSDSVCTTRCDATDTFCLDHITCYEDKCSYKQISAFAQHTEVANTGEAILDVFLDSATTNPASTAFGLAYSGKIGTSVILKSGEKYDFVSSDMLLATYETGTATTFTVGAHAINQYTGTRIPSSGSQTSSVVLTIYPDPTGAGFTITLGELGGL